MATRMISSFFTESEIVVHAGAVIELTAFVAFVINYANIYSLQKMMLNHFFASLLCT